MDAPVWDGETFCTVDGCHAPAMFDRLVGIVDLAVDDDGFCWYVDKVCVNHR